MNSRNAITLLLITGYAILGISSLSAQLSPGDLIEGHADLEGISNCTKCHTLGKKISNQKCLDCHDAIRDRVDRGLGYHASSEVVDENCFACHSDHHGRNFEAIRFDIERFDHDLTGYTLTGAHDALDCAECHKDQFISNANLRRKEVTYLGLDANCISCHDDYHQSTLNNDCTSCHTTDAFRPATNFEHSITEFPLLGQHSEIECIECHQTEVRNEQEFQVFSGIAFDQCSSCHSDPHQNRFGSDCKSCHTEESFSFFRGQQNFNHNSTGFPLRGQHRRVACADCHDMQAGASDAFQDFTQTDTEDCASCHDDVHDNRFGPDCRECHTEESFLSIVNLSESIDHNLTDFPLEGKHEEIQDCRECHSEHLTDPVPFQLCSDCHNDYHEGQFVQPNNSIVDCASCHTVDGFAGSSYTIDQHNAGPFPLEGAHLATPCFACHLKDENWSFRDIGSTCVDCHVDVHEGNLNTSYYPDNSCTSCHSPESWRDVAFNHDQTEFALKGAHALQSCVSCHQPTELEPGHSLQPFTGLSMLCSACHDNLHRDQFVVNGVTDCRRCHNEEQWIPSDFDHNSARFVLEGAHVTVSCVECHYPVETDDEPFVLYRTEKLECVDCHR